MNTARKGRALEHEVSRLLTDAGWSVVRGASSKGFFDSPDGKIKPDLVATRRGTSNKYELQIICIQAKVSARR